ncbi:unnamed protein product [Withania somnifera]
MNRARENAMGDERARENIMQAAQIHLVVATLIMTVTFTAGFTLPGGFESDTDSPNKGMVILLGRTAFRASCISGAVFTYFTMGASVISLTELTVVMRLYKMATCFQLVAMSAAVIAFMTGMYATLAHSVGLAATVCVIGCISFMIYLLVTCVLGSRS